MPEKNSRKDVNSLQLQILICQMLVLVKQTSPRPGPRAWASSHWSLHIYTCHMGRVGKKEEVRSRFRLSALQWVHSTTLEKWSPALGLILDCQHWFSRVAASQNHPEKFSWYLCPGARWARFSGLRFGLCFKSLPRISVRTRDASYVLWISSCYSRYSLFGTYL